LKPAIRRGLTFATLVSAGLVVVHLLSEDTGPIRGPAYGQTESPPEEAVTIRDVEDGSETRVTLGEVDFDVMRDIELDDGRIVTRAAYRVHVMSGAPGPEGDFLVDQPHITFLEPETGEVRGELQAERGRFTGQDTLISPMGFDPTNFQADTITLMDEVHGEIPMEDGTRGTFDSDVLIVEGDLLTAPGPVVWEHLEVGLLGDDMTWDGDTQVLRFERNTVVELRGDTPATTGQIESPGGLEWTMADSSEGRGYGTLYGPVSGTTLDGSHLQGQTLELSDDLGSFTLEGDARFDILRGEELWTLTARTVTARRTEGAGYELTRADGSVKVSSRGATPSMWFETERLDGQEGVLVAVGPVVGEYGDLDLAGRGLRWHDTAGTLDLQADVVIQDKGGAAASALFPGGRLVSPGGLHLETLADGMRLRLPGPVEGSLPGMGSFDCDVLTYDEFAGQLVLAGAAHVDMQLPDRRRQLSGERLTADLDELGNPTALSARDDVLLLETDGPEVLLRLAGPRLNVTSTLVSATEAFDLHWSGFDVTGEGLTLDDAMGRFEVDSKARIVRQRPDGLQDWLESDTGLTWWLPTDRSMGAEKGRGELRGPVRGETGDGLALAAGRVEITGANQRLVMYDDAELTWTDQRTVRSDYLEVVPTPGALRARTPLAVEWKSGLFEGSGVGLEYDELRGHLSLEEDARLAYEDESGLLRTLSCDGLLTWKFPPGALDPLAQGRGELRNGVVGSDGAGGGLSADRLQLDMPGRQVELFGECAMQRIQNGRLVTLQTEAPGYVRVTLDETAELETVFSSGRVDLASNDMRAIGDRFEWIVADDHVKLEGDCRLLANGMWTSAPRVEVWPEAMQWFIPPAVLVLDEKQ